MNMKSNKYNKWLMERKYLDVLLYLYKKKRITNIRAVKRKFVVGNNLSIVLMKANLIAKHKMGKWEWIGGEPTIAMAKRVISANKKIRLDERNNPKHPGSTLNLRKLADERKSLLDKIKKIDELFKLAKSLKAE